MAMIVSVECPSCETAFPVDPDKVPAGGARTECTECATPFRVDAASWGEADSHDEPWALPATDEDPGDAVDVADAPTEEWAPGVETWAPESTGEEGSDAWSTDTADPVELETPSTAGEDALEAAGEDAVEGAFGDSVELDDAVESIEEWDGLDLESSAEAEASGDDSLGAESVVEIEGEGPDDSMAPAGEIITDQWADLVDEDESAAVELTSDWGGDDDEDWVLETEEAPGDDIGEIEIERLDTVEEHVRAAQEDPELTEPAEGVDTNGVLDAGDGGLGDFMTGGEVVLPADALEVGGPGLHLDGDEQEVEAPSDSTDPGMAFDTGDESAGSEMAFDTGDDPTGSEVSFDTGDDSTVEEATFQFGRRDPHDKARRLARVLVSDMITYNPDRHTQALQNGSVKPDFEEEIEKSWAEYVEQVGPEIAESTDYWRDALNEILAGDEPLF